MATRPKARFDQNALGDRGESILRTALLTFHDKGPLFRPAYLGEKWPAADYVVELVGKPGHFFLVQVKTTSKGKNNRNRLKVRVDKKRYNALAVAKIPRYIVGIDSKSSREAAYIFAAAKRRKRGFSSVTTAYSLKSKRIRTLLFEEVETFWKGVSPKLFVNSELADD